MLLRTSKVFRTMPGYSGRFPGVLCALSADGGHARGTRARGASRGKRARASGSTRVNMSRARKAGGLSTMTRPRSARAPIELEQDRAAAVDSNFPERLPVKQILAHDPEGFLDSGSIKRLSLAHERIITANRPGSLSMIPCQGCSPRWAGKPMGEPCREDPLKLLSAKKLKHSSGWPRRAQATPSE
jgi:hypothetical protein